MTVLMKDTQKTQTKREDRIETGASLIGEETRTKHPQMEDTLEKSSTGCNVAVDRKRKVCGTFEWTYWHQHTNELQSTHIPTSISIVLCHNSQWSLEVSL